MHNKRQYGSTVFGAIFLLVVLSALTLNALTASTAALAEVGREANASQAYRAAQAGVQWTLYQATRATPGSCPTGSMKIGSYVVVVSCHTGLPSVESGSTILTMQISATACTEVPGGLCPATAFDPNIAERTSSAALCWNASAGAVC